MSEIKVINPVIYLELTSVTGAPLEAMVEILAIFLLLLNASSPIMVKAKWMHLFSLLP